jgi:hypothetical protein
MIAPLPDFGLIAGEAVTVRTPTVSYDEHMEEVTTWDEATVQNVIVTPGATSDVLDSTRPDGTRVAFTLGFPKTFTASLRGCRVTVRGIECAIIGDPQPYTADNTPGPWNYTAEVEAVDG